MRRTLDLSIIFYNHNKMFNNKINELNVNEKIVFYNNVYNIFLNFSINYFYYLIKISFGKCLINEQKRLSGVKSDKSNFIFYDATFLDSFRMRN